MLWICMYDMNGKKNLGDLGRGIIPRAKIVDARNWMLTDIRHPNKKFLVMIFTMVPTCVHKMIHWQPQTVHLTSIFKPHSQWLSMYVANASTSYSPHLENRTHQVGCCAINIGNTQQSPSQLLWGNLSHIDGGDLIQNSTHSITLKLIFCVELV